MPLFGRPGEGIAYEVVGSGPPLVLLHGFTASSATFMNNIPRLSGRFTVIAVELLGHGNSESPEEPGPYAPAPAVARMVDLMDHLGYDEFLLCGHSLGGALALRVALDHPDRVAGLVIINSNSAAGKPEWREAIRPRMQQLANRIRADGTEFMTHTRLFPGRSSRLPPEARAQLTRDFEDLQPAGVAGTAEALVVDVNAWERLGQLAVPTLVVIGDRDQDFVGAVEAFVGAMPRHLVSTVTLAGAGHAANLEQPEEFCSALLLFAAALDYLGGGARRARTGGWLTTVGIVLVAAGAAMVVAALFLLGDGGQPTAAPDEPGLVAGVAVTATNTATATSTATAPGPSRTPTPVPSPSGAAVSPTATPGTSLPLLPSPTPTATQPPSTNTPLPTASPTPPPPTPTSTRPAGPTAAISGPARAQPGVPVTFVDVSTPPEQSLTNRWSSTNGQQASASPFFSVTFASPGCYVVSLTVYFPQPPTPMNTTQKVAVGNATCP